TAQTQRAATPTFSVAPGSYPSAQTITITDTTPGATIYYTTDGSYPSTTSPVYSGPVTLARSTTLSAFATAPGYSQSWENFGAYYITSVPDSFLYTLAGVGSAGYTGDNGPATMAQFNAPAGIALDSAGNIYVADSYNSVIRRIDATTGIITTIAGTGFPGNTGDNGLATLAQLSEPSYLAFDSTGDLYISDPIAAVIRKVTISTGVITTFAGNSTAFLLGDNGPATAALLTYPQGIAFDAAGNLYIAESQRVRKVAAGTGIITTVAGGGFSSLPGPYGDGGPAVSAMLEFPTAVALDPSSNLYIVDQYLNSVRKVDAVTGIITTVAGTTGSTPGSSSDGGPATAARFYFPNALALDRAGNIYISDTYNWRIRKVDIGTGIINTIVGSSAIPCVSAIEDGAQATSGGLCGPRSLAFDKSGNLLFSDLGSVREMTPVQTPPATPTPAPTFSLAAGAYTAPQSVSIAPPTPRAAIHVTIDPVGPSGQSEVASVFNGYWRPIDVEGSLTIAAIAVAPGFAPSSAVQASYSITTPPSSVIHTDFGSAAPDLSGAGGPASPDPVGSPGMIAADAAGNLFITDSLNNEVWRVDAASGVIRIVAGNGSTGTPTSFGDNGPATSANLNLPDGIAVDTAGNIYIADALHNEVREVLASNGIIVPFAGTGSNTVTNNNYGDGGPATSAIVLFPQTLKLDAQGNLYIITGPGNVVREVLASTGIITTVAGNVLATSLGDGGPATSAQIAATGIALDSHSNLYISGAGRIRVVNSQTGIISTLAGDGVSRSTGDGLPATQAEVDPGSLVLDSSGNLFFSDAGRNIREIDAKTGIVSRFAGMDFEGDTGDGGSPLAATMCPGALLASATGNLKLVDGCAGGVRTITPLTYPLTPTVAVAASSSSTFVSSSVTFTANLSSIALTPTGTITFYDGATALGTGTLSSGVATYATSSLTAGAHSITAAYSGDTYFKAATSAPVTETIQDFTLAVATGSSASATIAKGSTATFTLAVAPSSGTTPAAISLAVTGAPTGATVTLTPASIAAGSGATSVTVSVNIPGAAAVHAAALHPNTPARPAPLRTIPVALGLLLLPFATVRRIRRTLGNTSLFLLVAISAATILTGCGGGGSSGGGNNTPPPQTYTLTVTATAGSLTHTTTLTLTVQ
ncbi:hypothetical protein DYQ86_20885, partial [Acidobacteria bacterium AB60]